MLQSWSLLAGVACTVIAYRLSSLCTRRISQKRPPRTRSVHQNENDIPSQSITIDKDVSSADLVLGPKLGNGTFGTVYKGKWKGALVAVKVVSHDRAGSVSYIAVAKEKLLGVASVHPNVVAVYAVMTKILPCEEPHAQSLSYSMQSTIVMELCDHGSLLHRLERLWEVLMQDHPKGMHMVLKCLVEVLFAMEYLHSVGIAHGDLNCANVLCASKRLDARGWMCKVADFGLSEMREGFKDHCSSHPGTALFAAPEVLAGGKKGFQSDVYAFGMLAWHLVSLGSPEADMLDGQVLYQVCERGWRPKFPSCAPGNYVELACSCWCQDMFERPSFAQLRGPLTALLEANPWSR